MHNNVEKHLMHTFTLSKRLSHIMAECVTGTTTTCTLVCIAWPFGTHLNIKRWAGLLFGLVWSKQNAAPVINHHGCESIDVLLCVPLYACVWKSVCVWTSNSGQHNWVSNSNSNNSFSRLKKIRVVYIMLAGNSIVSPNKNTHDG